MTTQQITLDPPEFITDVTLCAGYEKPLLSFVFDEMLTLALPTLDSHRGDLYHDALRLNDLLGHGGTAYFAVRSSGTDLAATRGDLPAFPEATVYEIEVYEYKQVGSKNWRAKITCIARPATMDDYSFVTLPGSQRWADGYENGKLLDVRFPGEDGHDLALAMEYNDRGPLVTAGIVRLLCAKEGQRDAESWVWVMDLDDGSTWWLEGWCDYTGWDCQSGVSWVKHDPLGTATSIAPPT